MSRLLELRKQVALEVGREVNGRAREIITANKDLYG
jgi:hypothetical protein